MPLFFQLLAPYLTPFTPGSSKRGSVGTSFYDCAVLTSQNIKQTLFSLTEAKFSTKTGPAFGTACQKSSFLDKKRKQEKKRKKTTLAARAGPESGPRKPP